MTTSTQQTPAGPTRPAPSTQHPAPSLRAALAPALAFALALGVSACNKVGGGPQSRADPPPAQGSTVYEPDLTKPEGPMLQMFRAAQDRDMDLMKASFVPTLDPGLLEEDAFRKFRKKVLTNSITPVPESVQMISDTEAVVRARNRRGREIPFRVQKVGDKWLISDIEFGQKSVTRFRERHPDRKPVKP